MIRFAGVPRCLQESDHWGRRLAHEGRRGCVAGDRRTQLVLRSARLGGIARSSRRPSGATSKNSAHAPEDEPKNLDLWAAIPQTYPWVTAVRPDFARIPECAVHVDLT